MTLLVLLLVCLVPLTQPLDPQAYGGEAAGLDAGLSGYRRGLQDRLRQGGPLGTGSPQAELVPGEQQEYEERYTITVQPRAASCFFLEELQQGYTLSIHYLVLSTRAGAQMDVGMTLKDPDKRLVPGAYKGRMTEFNFKDHKVEKTGDYELCFNNHFSVLEEKKVVWELDVLGDEERILTVEEEVRLAANQTLEQYLEEAQLVKKAMNRVRTKMSKARQHQWWLSTRTPKDIARLESVIVMIDRWSAAYSAGVLLVGGLQVLFLRRLFHQKPALANMKMRT